MENKENLYIRLFTPLKNQQEEDIWRLWIKNIGENILNKKEAIINYCKKERCDSIMAFLKIDNSTRGKYLSCQPIIGLHGHQDFYYFNSISELEDELVSAIDKKNGHLSDKNKKLIKDLITKIKSSNYFDFQSADELDLNDFPRFFSYKFWRKIEDEKEIERILNILLKERLENTEKYISDPLLFPTTIEDFSSLSDFEKNLYIPYSQNISSKPIENNKQEEPIEIIELINQTAELKVDNLDTQSANNLSIKKSNETNEFRSFYDSVSLYIENFDKETPLHYYKCFEKNKIHKIYHEFIERGVIDSSTEINNFEFVFGFNIEHGKEFKPISWIKSQNLLAYFVNKAFKSNDSNYLQIAEYCFRIKNNKINKKKMTSFISGIINNKEDAPSHHEIIDTALKL